MPHPSLHRARLKEFDFDFLAERFTADFPAYRDRFEECRGELRRFLEIPLRFSGPLACMSHGVDGLWHTLVNHTSLYRSFCNAVYGEYLDHQPHTVETPVPLEAISNFYFKYPSYFAAVPDIWLEDIPVHLREALREGEVPSEVQQLRWSGWPGRH